MTKDELKTLKKGDVVYMVRRDDFNDNGNHELAVKTLYVLARGKQGGRISRRFTKLGRTPDAPVKLASPLDDQEVLTRVGRTPLDAAELWFNRARDNRDARQEQLADAQKRVKEALVLLTKTKKASR